MASRGASMSERTVAFCRLGSLCWSHLRCRLFCWGWGTGPAWRSAFPVSSWSPQFDELPRGAWGPVLAGSFPTAEGQGRTGVLAVPDDPAGLRPRDCYRGRLGQGVGGHGAPTSIQMWPSWGAALATPPVHVCGFLLLPGRTLSGSNSSRKSPCQINCRCNTRPED